MQPQLEPTSIASILKACVGAYSNRTTKGYGADLENFVVWCNEHDACWLPASSADVAMFVDDQVACYRMSTIKRRLCAIAFAHRMLDHPTPTDSNLVRLAVRRAARQPTRAEARSYTRPAMPDH